MSCTILLTGATGYVGGRLLTLLQENGRPVRCLTRRPEALLDRMGPTSKSVQGDVLNPESLTAALEGIDTAYYFVHSMGENRDFESQDRIAAANFAKAATLAGVRRLIYLVRRSRQSRRDAFQTSAQSPRDRRHIAGLSFTGCGVPGLDRHRLG